MNYFPTRRRPNNRRRAETISIEAQGLSYTVTGGRSETGELLELFIQNHKNGSHADVVCRDAGIAASLALQHGCPVQVLRKALSPSGPLAVALDAIDGGRK
jgi:ribonucleoside-diphosphate reductase alpha chain